MAKDGPTYAELQAELSQGTLAPVYALYGEEDFLIDEAQEAIIHIGLGNGDRGFNLDIVHGGEADGRDVVARASSFPMMAERRVVVVREADKMPTRTAELLSSYVENPSPSTCLVLVGTKPDFRKKPFFTIRKAGGAFGFKPLYGDKIAGWIMESVKKGGKTIDVEGANLLAANTGTSLREVRNEIDKLTIYVADRMKITQEDVASIVGMSKEFTVFELQKVIGTRQTARAVSIMEHMIDAGEKPQAIIPSLSTYFTTLWKLHDMRLRGVPQKDQAAAAHVHPYFFREYNEALNVISPQDIERAFLHLVKADELSKTSSIDLRFTMQSLVILLCGAEGAGRGESGRNLGVGAGV